MHSTGTSKAQRKAIRQGIRAGLHPHFDPPRPSAGLDSPNNELFWYVQNFLHDIVNPIVNPSEVP